MATHWFDRFTRDLAASNPSRRSALQLALGVGIAGTSEFALAQERLPLLRGERPRLPPPPRPLPPLRERPPLLREPPPIIERVPPVIERPLPLNERPPPVGERPPPVVERPPAQNPPPTTEPVPAVTGQCTASIEGRRGTIEFTAQTSFGGKALVLQFAGTRDAARNTATRVLVKLAADVLIDGRFSTSPSGAPVSEAQLRFGPQIPGLNTLVLAVDGGRIVRGTLDGRRLLPFAATANAGSALRLADGGSLPPFQPGPPDLTAALQRLFARAQVIVRTCRSTTAPKSPRKGHGDGSHRSEPELDQACQDCYLGCDVGAGFGVLGDIVSGITGGPGALAGALAGTFTADLFCFNGCARGSGCCPVVCSVNPITAGLTTPADDPPCCESGEICLDKNSGICCEQGRVPCSNSSCCDPGEVCQKDGNCCAPRQICNGNAVFLCCPDGSICSPDNEGNPNTNGTHCCAEGHVACNDGCCSDPSEKCINGKCCLPGHQCGDTCCDELGLCIDNKFCCAFTHSPCGNSCCDNGDICINGACCHPAQHCSLADGSSFCCPPNHICDLAAHVCSTSACQTGFVPCAPYPTGPNLCCPAGHSCCNGACCPDKNQICCQPVEGLGQSNGQFGCNLGSYCLA